MKRITSMIMVFCLVFSLFTVTSSATSKKGKYVKVKRATYQKYKKAYNNQKNLKVEIQNLKTANQSLGEENYALKKQVEDLQNASSNEDIDELKHRLEQQEDINSWLWMSIKSMGISYSNKSWTVPAEYPEKFMINGTTYKVIIQEVEDENE